MTSFARHKILHTIYLLLFMTMSLLNLPRYKVLRILPFTSLLNLQHYFINVTESKQATHTHNPRTIKEFSCVLLMCGVFTSLARRPRNTATYILVLPPSGALDSNKCTTKSDELLCVCLASRGMQCSEAAVNHLS